MCLVYNRFQIRGLWYYQLFRRTIWVKFVNSLTSIMEVNADEKFATLFIISISRFIFHDSPNMTFSRKIKINCLELA